MTLGTFTSSWWEADEVLALSAGPKRRGIAGNQKLRIPGSRTVPVFMRLWWQPS